MRFLTYTIATGLGTGYSPLAPGTAGSLLAVVILYLAAPLHPALLLLLAVLLFPVGVYCSSRLEEELGTDPSKVVVDEIVGMMVSLIAVPADWRWFLAAFLLFRIFDIIKPPPARRAEKLYGGLGIMLDDVVAGIYALIGVHLLRLLF